MSLLKFFKKSSMIKYLELELRPIRNPETNVKITLIKVSENREKFIFI